MLNFFRRYQRIFFLFITVVIIISFTFFGALPSREAGVKKPNTKIGSTVSGKNIKSLEFENFVNFISTNKGDELFLREHLGVHLFEENFIKTEFLQTELASVIINEYLDLVKNDLESKLQVEKRTKLYKHPFFSALNTKDLWEYFSPTLLHVYEKYLSHEDFSSLEAIDDKIELYLEEDKFPSYALWQILKSQEEQFKGMPSDQNLLPSQLNLFGYNSIEDWFGESFVNLISQFVLNAASAAESKGYKVSSEEALTDLLFQNEKSFQKLSLVAGPLFSDSHEYFVKKLEMLGIDKSEAIKHQKNILLFKKLFDDVKYGITFDQGLLDDYLNFAEEGRLVTVYELPSELSFSSSEEIKLFQIYLKAIADVPFEGEKALEIPQSFSSIEDIEKKESALIKEKISFRYKEIDKSKLALRIPISKIWNYEIEKFDLIKKNVGELANSQAKSSIEIKSELKNLSKAAKDAVDNIAKEAILEKHPEWLASAIEDTEYKSIEIELDKKLPFGGSSKKRNEWVSLAKQVISEKDENLILRAKEKLSQYSFDEKIIYSFDADSFKSKKEILRFIEVKEILKKMLEKEEKNFFYSLKEIGEYQDKSFEDVKASVSKRYFEPFMSSIKKSAQSKTKSIDYTRLRFYQYLVETKNMIAGEDFSFLQDLSKSSFDNQFKLVKREVEVSRVQGEEYLGQKIFSSSFGKTSDVLYHQNKLFFFELKELPKSDQLGKNVSSKINNVLSKSSQNAFARKILKEIHDKNVLIPFNE